LVSVAGSAIRQDSSMCAISDPGDRVRLGPGNVFFYLGENDHGVLALGGNQNDRDCRQYEPRDRIVGYWWPKSAALPVTGKIVIKQSSELLAGGSEL
jgi:hypothetical protein